ncbi:MAG: DUF6460 domain-containing protein [Pseudomonadota bacterium]
MSNAVNRFLGGSPLAVAIKLVIISLLVGIVLSALGMTPATVIEGFFGFFERIWNLGFEAFGAFGDWLILGATLVIPIWLVMRILDRGRSG